MVEEERYAMHAILELNHHNDVSTAKTSCAATAWKHTDATNVTANIEQQAWPTFGTASSVKNIRQADRLCVRFIAPNLRNGIALHARSPSAKIAPFITIVRPDIKW